MKPDGYGGGGGLEKEEERGAGILMGWPVAMSRRKECRRFRKGQAATPARAFLPRARCAAPSIGA